MNFKYYLRGLGIGIIVTAIIMGIGNNGKSSLSNEEIKEKAKALGMVESTVLTQMSEEDTKEEMPAEETTQEATSEIETEEATTMTEAETEEATTEAATPAPTTEPTPEPTIEPTAKPTASPAATSTTEQDVSMGGKVSGTENDSKTTEKVTGNQITITVGSGESSYAVCSDLEAAGLIASASDFDTYLCQGGYDKKIRAGSHSIPADAEPESIAKILTGQQ